jgi:hypothetical protein
MHTFLYCQSWNFTDIGRIMQSNGEMRMCLTSFFLFFCYGASAHFQAMASWNFFLHSLLFQAFSWGFETNPSFTEWGQPHAQPPTWRTRVSIFCLGHHGVQHGSPCSYATAGIDLRILSPRKPRHYVKVGIPSAGPHFLHARSLCSSVPRVINFEIKVKTACLFVEERVL